MGYPMTLFLRSAVPLILLFVALVACAPSSRHEWPKSGSTDTSLDTSIGRTSPPKNTLQGSGDSGGGNGIANQVLESFVVDVTSLSEWKKHIAPIIADLDRAPKTWGEQHVLIALAKSKDWYIAPLSLSEIPKERLGLGFAREPLQQLALQTDREIWIDKSIYEKGHEEARAFLLLHELVLGLYTLKFKTESVRCQTLAANPNQDCKDTELIGKRHGPDTPTRSTANLDESDYQNIREMTSWLFNNRGRIDLQAYYEKLDKLSFDPGLIDPTIFHPEIFQTGPRPRLTWDSKTFINQLHSARRLGYFPQYCEYNDNLSAQAKCQFNLTTNGDQSRLRLSVKKTWPTSKIEKVEEYEFRVPEKLDISVRMPDLAYGKGLTSGLSTATFAPALSDPRMDQVAYSLVVKFKGKNSSEIPRIVSIAVEPLLIHGTDQRSDSRCYSTMTPAKNIAQPFFSHIYESLPSDPLFSTTAHEICQDQAKNPQADP